MRPQAAPAPAGPAPSARQVRAAPQRAYIAHLLPQSPQADAISLGRANDKGCSADSDGRCYDPYVGEQPSTPLFYFGFGMSFTDYKHHPLPTMSSFLSMPRP